MALEPITPSQPWHSRFFQWTLYLGCIFFLMFFFPLVISTLRLRNDQEEKKSHIILLPQVIIAKIFVHFLLNGVGAAAMFKTPLRSYSLHMCVQVFHLQNGYLMLISDCGNYRGEAQRWSAKMMLMIPWSRDSRFSLLFVCLHASFPLLGLHVHCLSPQMGIMHMQTSFCLLKYPISVCQGTKISSETWLSLKKKSNWIWDLFFVFLGLLF